MTHLLPVDVQIVERVDFLKNMGLTWFAGFVGKSMEKWGELGKNLGKPLCKVAHASEFLTSGFPRVLDCHLVVLYRNATVILRQVFRIYIMLLCPRMIEKRQNFYFLRTRTA